MKIQMKTLEELMKIPGIKFRSTYITNPDAECMTPEMLPFIGKEIHVIPYDSSDYQYMYNHGGVKFYVSDWMIHQPIPWIALSDGTEITIKDHKLYVGCQSLSVTDALLIAKFIKDNT